MKNICHVCSHEFNKRTQEPCLSCEHKGNVKETKKDIMATKKQIDKLDNLLEWKKEDRLFDNIKLFNQKVSPSMLLREIGERKWELEVQQEDENGVVVRQGTAMKHETLVNLGLTILDAITFSRDR